MKQNTGDEYDSDYAENSTDKNKSDNNKESGDERESEDEKNETLYGKTYDNLSRFHFNY